MTNRQRVFLIVPVVLLLLAVLMGPQLLFTVTPRQHAVVVQFGKPVRVYDEPGLHFKVPFIQEVRYLPRTYQFWIGTDKQLENVQTKDGKKIEVTPWVIWRISDPKMFLKKFETVSAGESRVVTFLRGPMRNVITANNLAEVVRSDSDRQMKYPLLADLTTSMEEASKEKGAEDEEGAVEEPDQSEQSILAQLDSIERIQKGRMKIVEEIKQIVAAKLAQPDEKGESRGIELVDVGIARIEFVQAVQEAAFQRQIAFRKAISSWYTNRGEQLKQEILNRTNAEVQKIEGEGAEQANVLRGEVEAEIIKNYAEAIRETGEFYNFVRTLEAYEEALTTDTRLVLTTNSAMFQLLKELPPVEELPAEEAKPIEKAIEAEKSRAQEGPGDVKAPKKSDEPAPKS